MLNFSCGRSGKPTEKLEALLIDIINYSDKFRNLTPLQPGGESRWETIPRSPEGRLPK